MSIKRPKKRDVIAVKSQGRMWCSNGDLIFCAFYDFRCPSWALKKCMRGAIMFVPKLKPNVPVSGDAAKDAK